MYEISDSPEKETDGIWMSTSRAFCGQSHVYTLHHRILYTALNMSAVAAPAHSCHLFLQRTGNIKPCIISQHLASDHLQECSPHTLTVLYISSTVSGPSVDLATTFSFPGEPFSTCWTCKDTWGTGSNAAENKLTKGYSCVGVFAGWWSHVCLSTLEISVLSRERKHPWSTFCSFTKIYQGFTETVDQKKGTEGGSRCWLIKWFHLLGGSERLAGV